MQNDKICVYAICKNEIKFVKQWLDNVSEADYIVVLDTGSTDGTFELLKEDPRVTKVEQKIITPWRFDVARNESMKLVPDDATVLVCTDFDEVFNEGWSDVIREYWDGSKYNRMYYDYAWSHNSLGEPTDIFKYDKIHTRDFHWKFAVHEVLWPNDDVIAEFLDVENKIFLQHYPDQTKERHYYFDLLRLACEENPEDSHERMLLAREYLLNEDYDKALEEYLNVLRMPDVDAPEKRLVLLESLGRCADIYKIKQNYDEALWYCQEFIKEDWSYREPYLIMAEIYNDMKMPTLAEAMVNQALAYSTRKHTWVERADTWMQLPDDILSYSYYEMRKYDKAIEYAAKALKHAPDDKRLLKNYSVFLECRLEEIKNQLEN